MPAIIEGATYSGTRKMKQQLRVIQIQERHTKRLLVQLQRQKEENDALKSELGTMKRKFLIVSA